MSQVSERLKGVIQSQFHSVSIRGEISGMKESGVGHRYFNLKDDKSLLNAVCWRGISLPFDLEDGMEIICIGSISIYQQRSTYQLNVQSITLSGKGAILELIEKRKQKLKEEGIFDIKKPLPKMPNKIAIITSERGAVIEDMLHRIRDRFPMHVLIYDVKVQGEGAASQISEAILHLNNHINALDIIIIARGGGSIEDLMCFNDENLARVISNSNIPIVSAIGHETDFTIADFAADLRAPTPSAAIELLIPNQYEVKKRIQSNSFKLSSYIESKILRYRIEINKMLMASSKFHQSFYQNISRKVDIYGSKLIGYKIDHILKTELILRSVKKEFQRINLTSLYVRLEKTKKLLSDSYLEQFKINLSKLENLNLRLAAFNKERIMQMGFSIVKMENVALKDINKIQNGSNLSIEMVGGFLEVTTKKVNLLNSKK
ncbi:Exodeoxyribonuclease 7 large subunit [Candidatus Cyrtobacter comes]|uniref:Exodeoxyribonuclease 7 large subunit n=1 Tax=Candidatus Cyrtobacter comes TaxID=675776 RepID=A0ABU5L822_9RICK|nr:exodeoxyribonuclease VII large subunit [Candidatus Cyrtobacter comes]MDZ5762025.1 Exodeoxyribonuclease 7 large subunit [Candidatus Cyrtobacter comes]